MGISDARKKEVDSKWDHLKTRWKRTFGEEPSNTELMETIADCAQDDKRGLVRKHLYPVTDADLEYINEKIRTKTVVEKDIIDGPQKEVKKRGRPKKAVETEEAPQATA